MNLKKGFTLTELLVVMAIALVVSFLAIQLLYLTFYTTKVGMVKDAQIDEINTIFYKLDHLFNNCDNFKIMDDNILIFSDIGLKEGIPKLNYEYEIKTMEGKLVINNLTTTERVFVSSDDVIIKNITYIPVGKNQLAIKLITENTVNKNIINQSFVYSLKKLNPKIF